MLRLANEIGKVNVSNSSSLEWTECYEDKLCAQMSVRVEEVLATRFVVSHITVTYAQVPLDYNFPNDSQVTIAMLKVPAKVPVTSKAYRGPILFNPGDYGLLRAWATDLSSYHHRWPRRFRSAPRILFWGSIPTGHWRRV